jgi:uncharacterized membrane protein
MLYSYVVLIVASLIGVFVAAYLRYVKRRHSVLHGDTDDDCHLIITSPYSTFFHIPVELLGLAYYVGIGASYLAFLLFPVLYGPSTIFLVVAASTAALTFSLYLLVVQLVTLRRWCTWCFFSAVLCMVIFASTISLSGANLVSILAANKNLIVLLHLIGAVIGVGGATVTDVFFFKFLRNFRIDEEEADILRDLSDIIWFGLGIAVLSGVGLYVPSMDVLHDTPKFIVKVIAVGIITINGVILNLYITPRMLEIRFEREPGTLPTRMHRFRRAAFASGAVSFISWYTALILGGFRGLTMRFETLLTIYLVALVLGVVGSQLFERHLDKLAKKR